MLAGEAFDFIVIDLLGFFGDAIGDEFVGASGKIQWMAVGEVPAVGKIHAEDGIAGLERGHVDADVGLRAGVGLDVGVLGAEKFFGAFDGEALDAVDVFASAVVALAGVALGVFVAEDGAHGFHDGFGDEIFGGDEFEAGGLAADLVVEGGGDFGVDLG